MVESLRNLPADLSLRDEEGTEFTVVHEMSQGDLGVVVKVHPRETATIDGDPAWFNFYAKIVVLKQQLHLSPNEAQGIVDRFTATTANDRHVKHDGLAPLIAMGRTESSDAEWHGLPCRISQSRRGRSLAGLLNAKWVNDNHPFDSVADELRRPPRGFPAVSTGSSRCAM